MKTKASKLYLWFSFYYKDYITYYVHKKQDACNKIVDLTYVSLVDL